MNHIVWLAPLVWAVSVDAGASCVPQVEPLEFPADGAPVKNEAQLLSVKFDPPAGAEVRRDTIITVDFEYRLSDFSPGRFEVTPLFKTGTNQSRSFDVDGKDPAVKLPSAAGRMRMCVPLAVLYDAEGVFWPLELWVMIVMEDGARGRKLGITTSKPVKFNAVDVPPAALARQAKAPPPEYDDALEYSFGYYRTQGNVYKACLQRFPPLQSKLTPAYRTWESRHRNDIDFVWTLKFESLRNQFDGRGDVAMTVLDDVAAFELKDLASWDAERLRDRCEEILEQLNPEDDHTAGMVSHHLVILRNWQAPK